MAHFYVVFIWNSTRPRKLKQPFQFWLVFEYYLYEIVLDHANRSNLFNFDPFLKFLLWEIILDHENRSNLFKFDPLLNGFCMKSYNTTQMEATFSILTCFWMVFVWNPARPRKSKQPVQISPVFEWFLYTILQNHANRSNLFNLDPFLNCFCRKSY